MNNKFTIPYLRKYINQELTDFEMHTVEKASHEDEFLMDIILGLEEEKKINHSFDAVDIDSRIYNRTHREKKRNNSYFKYLLLAASLILVFGIGFLWYIKKDTTIKPISSDAYTNQNTETLTDTTLNTIEIEDTNKEKIEENIIAMAEQDDQSRKASPEQPPITKEKRKEQELKKEITASAKLSLNPKVFYKEVPSATTIDTFKEFELNDDLQDNSLIVIASNKKPNRLKINGLKAERVSSPQDNKSVATGRVLDLESGRPIINASIRNIKTNDVVVTDSFGQFIMPLTADKQSLQALSIGYKTQDFISSNNKIVQLKSDYNNLGEASSMSSSKENFQIKSEPLIGWIAYKKYINDHVEQTLLGKGDVTLIFDISTFGRPIDIQIKKTATYSLNQKAIQIIQNGPDWKKGNDGKKIEVKISFK